MKSSLATKSLKSLSGLLIFGLLKMATPVRAETTRPNILIMISDDQSFPHASAYGSKMIATPNFDRIAKSGALFTNAFSPSPGCSPSRAAFLTGREIWQIEHAGTHASSFGKKYETFMNLLEKSGYHTGFVGKGWGPGKWEMSGRTKNPAGNNYGNHHKDYAKTFDHFLKARPSGAPFVFWFGSADPHRDYKKGTGLSTGKTLADAEVPPFLPDTPEIREDILDYAYEVERFDRQCGKVLELLQETREAENTLIIITSDNGMPFPYAKANCNEFGTHVPLAIAWEKIIPGGQKREDLVSLIDITATIHEITGINTPKDLPLSGQSLLRPLIEKKTTIPDTTKNVVFTGRERHSSSRYRTLAYPQRAIRTQTHLLIKNFKPERWPAGTPQRLNRNSGILSPPHSAYHDIDACPSQDFLEAYRDHPKIKFFFQLAVKKRPAIELYHIGLDPGCLNNLAADPEYKQVKKKLLNHLEAYLKKTSDPRILGNGDIFETYPRYSGIRHFTTPDWAKEHPQSVPEMPWLDSH